MLCTSVPQSKFIGKLCLVILRSMVGENIVPSGPSSNTLSSSDVLLVSNSDLEVWKEVLSKFQVLYLFESHALLCQYSNN